MANTEIMPKNTYIGAEIANKNIYEAYQTNRDVWQANKDVHGEAYRNKDRQWESLIINRGCRFLSDRKKLTPAPSIKEFFFAKCVKIVVI